MAGIYKRTMPGGKSKSWYGKFYLPDGQIVWRSLKTSSLKEARKRAAVVDARIIEGEFKTRGQGDYLSVSDLLDHYFEEHSLQSKRCWSRDETSIKPLKALLGSYKLAKLSPKHLSEYVKARRNGGVKSGKRILGPVTNTTIYHDLKLLKHAFKLAIEEWEFLEETPFRKFKLPKQNPSRDVYLSKDELLKIRKHLPESMLPIVEVALHTALRLSNIINLKWSEVDFSNHFISVVAKGTGNGKSHKVAINDTVYRLLMYIRENRGNVISLERSEFVFLHENGKPYKKDSASQAFRRAAKLANVSARFHDLRHTCLSNLGARGASTWDLVHIAGHSDPRMTKKYTHPVDERMRALVGTLDG